MRKVALYVRVSTDRQDQEGYSIPLQKERLFAFCKARGWLVSGLFVDPGHSGATLDRPGIEALMAAVEEGRFDVVLVYKLDRLSRSQKDTLHLIEDIFLKNNTEFVSVQESFDTGNVYGRAMVGILSVFAQLERETIRERTLMGRTGRAQDGLWHGGGTDAIGYDYVDGELVVNEEEADQVRRVFELFAAGHTLTFISEAMDGFKTKHGDWRHTSTIGNVLDNPLYAGIVHFDGVEAEWQHTAIISRELFETVRRRRERLKYAASASRESRFLLTGMIYCDECGARYFANRRPNGSHCYSCHSRAKKNKKMVKDPNCTGKHWSLPDLDSMVEAEVLRLASDPSLVDDLVYKKRAAEESGSGVPDAVAEELNQIDSEVGRMMDLYQYDDLVNVEEIAGRIEQLHNRRQELRPNAGGDGRVKDFDVEGAKLILRDLAGVWGELDTGGKRGFLLLLIDKILVRGDEHLIEWSFL